jgi:hypothetical protein
MGFFDRIFGRKSRSVRRWTAATNAKLENPAMLVLLVGPPVLEVERTIEALAAIEPLSVKPKFTPRETPESPVSQQVLFNGTLDFDSHSVDIAGFNHILPPEVLERTVEASHWTGEGREAMQKHKAYLLLSHRGGGANPAEKYIALYKVAATLAGENLAGVLIEDAWTCAPANVVREFLKPEFLKTCREQAPPILFTGFVKFKGEKGAWFVTKGQHIFGAPDFVMQAGDADEPEKALDLFMNIFLYVVSADRELKAGHTMQIAEEYYLRFGELQPDHPHVTVLKGAGRTLLITRIRKDEINKKG